MRRGEEEGMRRGEGEGMRRREDTRKDCKEGGIRIKGAKKTQDDAKQRVLKETYGPGTVTHRGMCVWVQCG